MVPKCMDRFDTGALEFPLIRPQNKLIIFLVFPATPSGSFRGKTPRPRILPGAIGRIEYYPNCCNFLHRPLYTILAIPPMPGLCLGCMYWFPLDDMSFSEQCCARLLLGCYTALSWDCWPTGLKRRGLW
jgi:hypothetical protein